MPKKGPKDWDPQARVKELETLATEMVGDGKKPNLFFVSEQGNILLVTRIFQAAYDLWYRVSLRVDVECALEDRLTGVIASVEPSEDDPKKLMLLDMSRQFGFR